MNRIKILLLVLLVAFASIAAGCNASFSTAKIADATLATEVNANKEAVGSASTFEPTVPIIHCVVKLANAPESTKLNAKWIAVNVEGEQPNTKIVESNIDAVGNNNILDFTFKPTGNGLPQGEYKVDIYLNPKEGDQPTRSLPFTIK